MDITKKIDTYITELPHLTILTTLKKVILKLNTPHTKWIKK